MRITFKSAGAAAAIPAMYIAVSADVPASERPTAGIDWAYVATGMLFAFAGALLFVWLGRKFTGNRKE